MTDHQASAPLTHVALHGRCPRCGKGRLFDGFIKIAEKCDVCGGEVGNPASPGDGSKRQDETDWQDAAAHPLSFIRHYRTA